MAEMSDGHPQELEDEPGGDWDEEEGDEVVVPFTRLDDEEVRSLTRRLIDVDWGTWRRADLDRVWARLGWEWASAPSISQWWDTVHQTFQIGPLGPPGTAYSTKPAPDHFHMVEISLASDGEPGDQVEAWRDIWPLVAEVLGPVTRWGGKGPWALWQRPGLTVVVKKDTHFDEVSLQVWRGNRDDHTNRDSWRAAAPADLPTARPAGPVTWDGIRDELAQALEHLTEDAPWFPAAFILHLQADNDPRRLVQAWNEGADLRIEATGLFNYPELADPDRLAALGWNSNIRMWQRRFPGAMERAGEDAVTAAHMLVDALQMLQVEPAGLSYDGTLTRRDGQLHLDLPRLGIARGDADA
jgi:hypothetical protein